MSVGERKGVWDSVCLWYIVCAWKREIMRREIGYVSMREMVRGLEKESEKERGCYRERKKKGGRERDYKRKSVFLCERESVRERVFMCVIEYIWDRKRKCVRDGVEVWESERKNKRKTDSK